MACRKGELREETKNRNDAKAAASVAAVGDALLFTMMCIIGMPVDVHAKDGSIYSGIFHTASVDEDYAIVLKKARMIKKGNLDVNVVIGTLIETLIVRSEDLVQVVAKGVLLPSNGITGYVVEDGIQAASGYNICLNADTEVVKPNKSRGNKKHKSQSRLAAKKENDFPYSSTTKAANTLGNFSNDYIERLDAVNIVQMEEAQNVSADGRLVRDCSKSELQNSLEFQDKGMINEIRGSSPTNDTLHQEPQGVPSGCTDALVDQDQEKVTSDGAASTVDIPTNITVTSTPVTDVKSDTCLSASSNPFLLIPPKSSSVKRTIKESKLNPGAKMFSPSTIHHRTVTPPAAPNGVSDSYMSGTYTMAPMATAHEEIDGNSFARSSMLKFVPYSNVAFVRGGNDAPYVQPIMRQVVNRTQPVRYTGQFQNIQTGHTYFHPSPQNVFGRAGPLVCMHPIPSDVVHSAAGFSAAASRPALTPHQVHLPKHQGNASAQALQLYINPPIMANGPPSFVMPSSIPISQPVFPVLQQIAVPGTNGFLSSKLA